MRVRVSCFLQVFALLVLSCSTAVSAFGAEVWGSDGRLPRLKPGKRERRDSPCYARISPAHRLTAVQSRLKQQVEQQFAAWGRGTALSPSQAVWILPASWDEVRTTLGPYLTPDILAEIRRAMERAGLATTCEGVEISRPLSLASMELSLQTLQAVRETLRELRKGAESSCGSQPASSSVQWKRSSFSAWGS